MNEAGKTINSYSVDTDMVSDVKKQVLNLRVTKRDGGYSCSPFENGNEFIKDKTADEAVGNWVRTYGKKYGIITDVFAEH